jgi:hypothetical protein
MMDFESCASQGDPINWFSPHQRAILGGLDHVQLQLLVRHCRKPMDAESQYLEDLKAEIARLKQDLASKEDFPSSFVEALEVAQKGFDHWRDHWGSKNPELLKRIDGTPIINDLLVLIAKEFVQHSREETK